MARDRANRTRKKELKIYLSDNEQYILDRKVELSKRKSASDYIRTLILFGFVYDVDYSYLRQYNETLGTVRDDNSALVLVLPYTTAEYRILR